MDNPYQEYYAKVDPPIPVMLDFLQWELVRHRVGVTINVVLRNNIEHIINCMGLPDKQEASFKEMIYQLLSDTNTRFQNDLFFECDDDRECETCAQYVKGKECDLGKWKCQNHSKWVYNRGVVKEEPEVGQENSHRVLGFTGKKDKNGNNIKEMDKIKALTDWNLSKAVIEGTVIWDQNNACYSVQGTINNNERCFPLKDVWDIEVIE